MQLAVAVVLAVACLGAACGSDGPKPEPVPRGHAMVWAEEGSGVAGQGTGTGYLHLIKGQHPCRATVTDNTTGASFEAIIVGTSSGRRYERRAMWGLGDDSGRSAFEVDRAVRVIIEGIYLVEVEAAPTAKWHVRCWPAVRALPEPFD